MSDSAIWRSLSHRERPRSSFGGAGCYSVRSHLTGGVIGNPRCFGSVQYAYQALALDSPASGRRSVNRRSFLWRAFCSSLPLFARSGVSERLHAPVVSKPSDATLAAFAHGLAGRVFRPGDKQYEQLRKGYAAKFDAHPALVVSPANTRDIQATLGFASSHRLPLAIRLLAAQISFRRQHANMTKEELNLFQFLAIHMTELCAGSPEIVWSEMVHCIRSAHLRTTYQMTSSDIPLPQGVPCRLTARKIRPAVTFADSLHRSTACLTQAGTGTVRT